MNAEHVEIRDAHPDEHTRVAELTLAAYDALDHRVSGEYRQILADVDGRVRAGAHVLVAVDAASGAVVGAVTLTLDDNEYFEYRYPTDGDCGFRMLAVDPGHWGRGVGAALVSACIERARAAGCRLLTITSMPWMRRAHAMYERRGFVRRPELDRSYGDSTGLAFSLPLTGEEVPTHATRHAREGGR